MGKMRQIGSIKVFDRNAVSTFSQMHQQVTKKSVVKGLTDCDIRLSHDRNQPKYLKTIKMMLRADNYPPCFYELLFKTYRITQLYNKTKRAQTKQCSSKYVAIPYVLMKPIFSQKKICSEL